MTALDPSKQGIEAQKLISISLGKMAASRVGKSGSSLHKSLLVASVLHRARHVFLEENYHNYHYRGPTIAPVPIYAPQVPPPPPASCPPAATPDNDENSYSAQTIVPPQEMPTAKEEGGVVPRMPLGDASNQQQRVVALKRRRCVSDKETQDAVSSILPKRFRSNSESGVCHPVCALGGGDVSPPPPLLPPSRDCATEESSPVCCAASENVLVPIPVSDNVLLPVCAAEEEEEEESSPTSPSPFCASESTTVASESARDSTTITTLTTPMTSNPIYCTLEPISDDEDDDDDVNSMEVEHITSLVSIFSFGAPRKDLCATQAAREEPAQFTPVALAV